MNNIYVDSLLSNIDYYKINKSDSNVLQRNSSNIENNEDIIYFDKVEISDKGRVFVKAKKIVEDSNNIIREELVKRFKEQIEKQLYFTEETAELLAEKIVNGWRSWN